MLPIRLGLLLLVVSCAPAAAPASSPDQVKPETRVERTAAQLRPVAMRPPQPSALVLDVKAIGLDPRELAPLERLPPDKLRQVMQTFTKSLGVKCADCHLDDFAAPTPKKRIAARMWDEFVRGLTFTDGTPVYCDSCHQGRAVLLDRRDQNALSDWMTANFVTNLQRRDGRPNGCPTCHGEKFDPRFLNAWASERALTFSPTFPPLQNTLSAFP
jgi:hypothetical protein